METQKTNIWVVILKAISYIATAIAGYLSNGILS